MPTSERRSKAQRRSAHLPASAHQNARQRTHQSACAPPLPAPSAQPPVCAPPFLAPSARPPVCPSRWATGGFSVFSDYMTLRHMMGVNGLSTCLIHESERLLLQVHVEFMIGLPLHTDGRRESERPSVISKLPSPPGQACRHRCCAACRAACVRLPSCLRHAPRGRLRRACWA